MLIRDMEATNITGCGGSTKPLVSCRCAEIIPFAEKRVKELNGIKKYARDQFSLLGVIEAQLKYWSWVINGS